MLPPSSFGAPPRRRDRGLAFVVDLAWGLLALLVSTVAAVSWLFIRSGWGGRDVSEGDSIIAAAIIAAAAPAWLAWLALSLTWESATPGQRLRRLTVAIERPGRRAPRSIRLLLHPVAVPGWCWLTVHVWLTTIPFLPALLAVATAAIVFLSVVSAAIAAYDPAAPALHDRIAGTRLYRRQPYRREMGDG